MQTFISTLSLAIAAISAVSAAPASIVARDTVVQKDCLSIGLTNGDRPFCHPKDKSQCPPSTANYNVVFVTDKSGAGNCECRLPGQTFQSRYIWNSNGNFCMDRNNIAATGNPLTPPCPVGYTYNSMDWMCHSGVAARDTVKDKDCVSIGLTNGDRPFCHPKDKSQCPPSTANYNVVFVTDKSGAGNCECRLPGQTFQSRYIWNSNGNFCMDRNNIAATGNPLTPPCPAGYTYSSADWKCHA